MYFYSVLKIWIDLPKVKGAEGTGIMYSILQAQYPSFQMKYTCTNFLKSFNIFFLFAPLIQFLRRLTFCPIWVEDKAT